VNSTSSESEQHQHQQGELKQEQQAAEQVVVQSRLGLISNAQHIT